MQEEGQMDGSCSHTGGRKCVLSKGSGPGGRAGGGSSQTIKLWVLVADIKGWVGRRARADLGG